MKQPSIMLKIEDFFHSNLMHWVITVLVLANAIILGLKTESSITSLHGPLLETIDHAIITVLVIEIIVRFLGTQTRFFKRFWNVFDAVVLAISVVAILYEIEVLQALRIILIFRLVELLPKMKHVVDAIARALHGITNAVILLMVIFYTFAVAGTHLFSGISQENFGDVAISMFTLFQLMAFDELGNVIRPLMDELPYAWAFFVLFLGLSAFSILNLFIGIVVQAMQDASADLERSKDDPIAGLKSEVSALKQIVLEQQAFQKILAQDLKAKKTASKTKSPKKTTKKDT
tara:strand:- start:388 stop:1254 length:867 start_codon:yes stop_codon:yes gene_type:complete